MARHQRSHGTTCARPGSGGDAVGHGPAGTRPRCAHLVADQQEDGDEVARADQAQEEEDSALGGEGRDPEFGALAHEVAHADARHRQQGHRHQRQDGPDERVGHHLASVAGVAVPAERSGTVPWADGWGETPVVEGRGRFHKPLRCILA